MFKKRVPSLVFTFFQYVLGIAGIALTTGILFLLRDKLSTTTVALLYLLPVLTFTTFWGLGPGVLSAFIAFLAYNYFFLVPYYTFIVHQSQDIIALVIFLVVAVLISQLVGRAKAGLAAAVARESETTLLYEFSLELSSVSDLEGIARVIIRKTSEIIQPQRLELRIEPAIDESPFDFSSPEEDVPLTGPDMKLPLETVRASLGELCLWLDGQILEPSAERILRTFAAQGALAIERIALERAQTRAKVIEESDRLKSALLSSVSHEFRTPLATIKAATTSLLSDEVPWEADIRKELLSSVDEESDYLNYLVGNLLDMSRIEAGALKPNRQWNELSEIVEGVVVRMHRMLKDYLINIDIPEDLSLIPVDYAQIEQVFTNLIHNSTKYAPPGSRIQIRAHRKEETSLQVYVINESPQIPPDHLDKIFDRFYRITEPEKVSGIGLGLSICKGIVEAHGGRIWAENTSEGFSFVFTIPLILDGSPPPVVNVENL